MGYDFDIEYRPGLENKAVDALSRRSDGTLLMALNVPTTLSEEDKAFQVFEDGELQCIVSALQRGEIVCFGFTMV